MSSRRKNTKRKIAATAALSEIPEKVPKTSTSASKAKIPRKIPTTKNVAAAAATGSSSRRQDFKFYDVSCLDLAKKLLGQTLFRRLDNGTIISGTIVETESYLGNEDPSAHSYSGQTDRNRAMFMPPGTAYVYNIYGTYCCMNISSRNDGHAVLLRALEPVDGIEQMHEFRQKAKKQASSKPMKEKELCSGPSKFCQALSITKAGINEQDMVTSGEIWLEEGAPIANEEIVIATRIGIEGAGAEAASKPYRFYVRGNVHVSKRDKTAESSI